VLFLVAFFIRNNLEKKPSKSHEKEKISILYKIEFFPHFDPFFLENSKR